MKYIFPFVLVFLTSSLFAQKTPVIMKKMIEGKSILVELSPNVASYDPRYHISDSLALSIDKNDPIKLQIGTVTEESLMTAIAGASSITITDADLIAFCKKIQVTYKKYYPEGFDFSQDVKYNLTIFSDLYGLSGSQPNGLVQPSFYVSFPLARKSIKLSENSDWQLLRNVMFQITASKIDNHLRDLPTIKEDTLRRDSILYSRVNFTDIIQYAYLNINLRLNLFHLSFQHHSLYVDAMVSNSITNVYDSLNKQSISVPTYGYGWNIKYATRFYGRFNMEAFFNRQYTTASTNDLIISNSPQYHDIGILKQTIKAKQVSNNENTSVYNSFGVQLNIQDADRKGTVFARCVYFTNGDFQKFNNSFFQIQVGYTINFDEFIKPLSAKKP
jgi:hypothetical protein